MNAETIERLKKDEASLADAPWCEMWLSMGIRHLSRNCDLDCPNDDPYHDCGCPGRYDGAALARMRNALPSLLARVRELEATVREREAEILRLRTTETASAHALDRVRQACGLPERSAPFDVASFVENHLARKDTPCGD